MSRCTSRPGFALLGAEYRDGRLVYLFDNPEEVDALREYSDAKARLDTVADAVRGVAGGREAGVTAKFGGKSTSRPGANTFSWWTIDRSRRSPTVEVVYVITQGPLDLRGDERLFLLALWRHKPGKPWPTDEQWAARFDVTPQPSAVGGRSSRLRLCPL